eukprot:g14128.t1
MSNLASFDTSWDVRDTARALKSIKESAKAALSSDAAATPLEQMGLWYCRACISGTPPLDAAGLDEKSEDGPSKAKVKDVSAEKAREAAPKSISSSTEQRVQLPSNINNMPVVQSLEDLDLFYSEAPPPPARSLQPQPAAAANPATLEQMRLAGSVAAVGTAVCGEDDESDEEAEEDDDDWKYCQQAIPSSSTAKDLDPPAPQAAEAPVRQELTEWWEESGVQCLLVKTLETMDEDEDEDGEPITDGDDKARLGILILFLWVEVSVFNVSTAKEAYRLNRAGSHTVKQVCWRPESASASLRTRGVLVGVSTDGKVRSETEQLFCVDYSSDGKMMATGGLKAIFVIDEETKKQTIQLEGGNYETTAGHSNRVQAVRFLPADAPWALVSGGWDNSVQYWDLRAGLGPNPESHKVTVMSQDPREVLLSALTIGHAVKAILGPHICGDSLDVSSDGRHLLTGSYRDQNPLELWDLAQEQRIKVIPWRSSGPQEPACFLYTARFSKDPHNSLIAAGACGVYDDIFMAIIVFGPVKADPLPTRRMVVKPRYFNTEDGATAL